MQNNQQKAKRNKQANKNLRWKQSKLPSPTPPKEEKDKEKVT